MEKVAQWLTIYVSHAVEIVAACIIAVALIKAFFNYILRVNQDAESKERLRISFGSSVAIALELMLGADVLATAVSPNWGDIGKLAAIAAIRTALNYFLGQELKPVKSHKSIKHQFNDARTRRYLDKAIR
jgi:uncharacterized membrane protein